MTVRPSRILVGALLSLTPLAARADDKAQCISASEKAQQLRDDHKLLEAREQLLVCGRDVCPGPVRKDCADMLQQVDARTPSIVIRAKGQNGADLVDVKVSVHGVPLTDKLDGRAIPIDPGVHEFHLEAAGVHADQSVVVAEGEQNRVVTVQLGAPGEVTPPPGTPSRGAPIGAFVVGGIGVLAAGVAAPIFYVMGLDQKSADESPTGCKNTQPGGCSQAEIDSIRTKLIVGDVFMGVGVAAVIGGVVWAIVHYSGGSKEAPAAAKLDIAPAAYGRGAVASATLRF